MLGVTVRSFRHYISVADSAENPGKGAEDSLDDMVRGERDYVRERMRSELNREPSEEEIDEWLREQTEGY